LINNETIDISMFLNNENDEIRKFATKMIADEPNLSNFWKNNGANLPDPNETYVKDIEKCIIDFKMAIVNIFIKKTSEELQNPNISFDEQKAILERSKEATTLRTKLNELRGNKNFFKI